MSSRRFGREFQEYKDELDDLIEVYLAASATMQDGEIDNSAIVELYEKLRVTFTPVNENEAPLASDPLPFVNLGLLAHEERGASTAIRLRILILLAESNPSQMSSAMGRRSPAWLYRLCELQAEHDGGPLNYTLGTANPRMPKESRITSLLEVGFEKISQRRGVKKRRVTLETVSAFLKTPLSSRNEIIAFARWLCDTGAIVHDGLCLLSERSAPRYLDNPDRRENVGALERALKTQNIGPVHCVISEGSADASRAFANYLAVGDGAKIIKSALPHHTVCFLPLEDSQRIDYGLLVAQVFAYYRGQDMRSAKSARSEEEILNQVRYIRRCVATTPTLFIFDSWEEHVSSAPHLETAVVDKALPQFLRQVLHPLERPYYDEQDRLLESQYLVLGNSCFSQLAGYQSPPIELSPATDVDYVAYMTEKVGGVSKLDSFANASVLQEYLCLANRYLTDEQIGLLDAIINLEGGTASSRTQELFDVPTLSSLAEHFVSLVRERGGVFEIALILLSLTFSGLRFQSAENIAFALVQRAGFSPNTGLMTLRGKLESAFSEFDPLLKSVKDAAQPTLEIWDKTRTKNERAQEDVFQFKSPTLRKSILSEILGNISSNTLGLFEIAISQECFRQGGIMLASRYTSAPPYLWDLKRTVEGVFHGVRALCADDKTWAKARACGLTSLPGNRVDALKEMMGDRYLAIIEGGESYDLTKLLNAESARADLMLQFFSVPKSGSAFAHCMTHPLLMRYPPQVGLGSWLRDTAKTDPAVSDLLQACLNNFARTSQRINRMDAAIRACALSKQLQALANDNGEHVNTSLKIEFDNALLSDDRSLALRLCKKGLAHSIAQRGCDDALSEQLGEGWYFELEQIARLVSEAHLGHRSILVDRTFLLECADKLADRLETVFWSHGRIRHQDIKSLGAACDFLDRFGYLHAQAFEREGLISEVPNWEQLASGFLSLKVSSLLRKRIFNHSPRSSNHKPNFKALYIRGRLTIELICMLDVAPENADDDFMIDIERLSEYMGEITARSPVDSAYTMLLNARVAFDVGQDVEETLRLLQHLEQKMTQFPELPMVLIEAATYRAEILLVHASDQPIWRKTSPRQALEWASEEISRAQKLIDDRSREFSLSVSLNPDPHEVCEPQSLVDEILSHEEVQVSMWSRRLDLLKDQSDRVEASYNRSGLG